MKNKAAISFVQAILGLTTLGILLSCANNFQRPPRDEPPGFPTGTHPDRGVRNGAPPPTRPHSVTTAQDVTLQPATQSAGQAYVDISVSGNKRKIISNGIPSHNVGQFPNSGNPNRISPINYQFEVTTSPRKRSSATKSEFGFWGVAVNGVPFEPGTAEFWQGQRGSAWNYDALGGAVPLGLDANNAHVQPNGAYHYHGLPVGLMQELGWSSSRHSPLIGWAADGFPIYALTGDLRRGVVRLKSSYSLKSGQRPGGQEPNGTYDGAFVQDWQYIAGSGDLDNCNGTVTYSPEFPNGSYAYFLTDDFPFIPRCWMGTPDMSFNKR